MAGGTAYNCTFVGNAANGTWSWSGGGAMQGGAAINCIAWDNTSRGNGDNFYATAVRYSCSPDVLHGVDGNITNMPLLASASHITTESPCVGAGSTDRTFELDIDGEVWRASPSMGCDEVYAPATGTLFVSLSGSEKICLGFSGTYDICIRGALTRSIIDFDDGQIVTNAVRVQHAWNTSGTYTVTLTAFNDEYPEGVSDSIIVRVYTEQDSAIYVSDLTGNDNNDGSSWAKAGKTIQAGIDKQKVLGGIVWVTNGTYVLSAEISVTNAITIRSVNGPEVTVVDGNRSNRCFNLTGNCFVCGFTIQNGVVSLEHDGGGVLCSSTNPVVSNCLIVSNGLDGADGGWCNYGGGMNGGTARDCIFRANKAEHGGGAAGLIAINCVFKQNYTEGISSFGWDFGDGGGMSGGSAYNCTFVGNSSFGGGIGGGMINGAAYNCVFSGNTANMDNDLYGSTVYNSCSLYLEHGVNGNITNAPLFVDAANGGFWLQSNSPCINWGNNSVVSNATDLAGNPRIVEGTVDMGAYEYQGTVGLTDSDSDGINDDWERQHGGNQRPDATCSNGVNTILQAYIAGLDPNDPQSKFQTSGFCPLTSGNALQWQGVSGRVYAIYYSTNLLNGFQPLATNIPWTAGCYTDSVHNAQSQGYYKIDVKLND